LCRSARPIPAIGVEPRRRSTHPRIRGRETEKSPEALAAERDAELDKLTVRARLAVGRAGELTTEKLREILRALVARAQEGGHVGTNAARLVFELASKATEDEDKADELGDDLTWDQMTQEQRAVARARADALARSLSLDELGDGDPQGQGTPAPPSRPPDPRARE
jgi:hypothetical protein